MTAEEMAAPSSAAASAAARAVCRKGHRLPATAVVLSPDETFAVTVSKDGSIVRCGGGVQGLEV